MSPGPAVAALMFNALVWGCSWLPLRWLAERGLHSLWTTGLTYAIGVAMIAIVRPRALLTCLNRPGLLALALAAGVTNASFNWALTVGSVIRVVLLFYLMPVWSALLARWLIKEPITRSALARILIALAGAVIVLGRGEVALPVPTTQSDWLALIAGVGFAATNVLLRYEAATPSARRAGAMFCGSGLIACATATAFASGTWFGADVATAAVALPFGSWAAWGLPLIAFAAVFLSANLALQYGAARLPANVTALIMLSEIVFATGSAIVLGNEHPGPSALIGAALILTAALLATLQARDNGV